MKRIKQEEELGDRRMRRLFGTAAQATTLPLMGGRMATSIVDVCLSCLSAGELLTTVSRLSRAWFNHVQPNVFAIAREWRLTEGNSPQLLNMWECRNKERTCQVRSIRGPVFDGVFGSAPHLRSLTAHDTGPWLVDALRAFRDSPLRFLSVVADDSESQDTWTRVAALGLPVIDHVEIDIAVIGWTSTNAMYVLAIPAKRTTVRVRGYGAPPTSVNATLEAFVRYLIEKRQDGRAMDILFVVTNAVRDARDEVDLVTTKTPDFRARVRYVPGNVYGNRAPVLPVGFVGEW